MATQERLFQCKPFGEFEHIPRPHVVEIVRVPDMSIQVALRQQWLRVSVTKLQILVSAYEDSSSKDMLFQIIADLYGALIRADIKINLQ